MNNEQTINDTKAALYLKNIIRNMPGSIYWKDKEGLFLGCNDFVVKMAGLNSQDDIIGKSDYELVWKDVADQIRKNDLEIMQSKESRELEEIVTLFNGEKVVMLTNKTPLFDDDHTVIGIIGISVDITAKKEAERLKQEKEAAEQKALYLRAAAGSIAHELRTPLASIKMATEFISKFWHTLLSTYKLARLKQLDVEEISNRPLMQLEGRIDSVLQQTRYANAFIDLVLGNLKEEQEINTDKYHICDMVDVVNQCLLRYPFQEGEEPLLHWDPENEFEFLGDEFFMMNVLNNLIKNSLYFIKEARKGEMFIWLEKGASYNTLYFKDTAKGAAEEVIARLFESFYSKRKGGTGLGLAFCKKIMKSFGGDIASCSVENEYIQFALSFPAVENV